MAEYRSIKNVCCIKYTLTKTGHRQRGKNKTKKPRKCFQRSQLNVMGTTRRGQPVCAPCPRNRKLLEILSQ